MQYGGDLEYSKLLEDYLRDLDNIENTFLINETNINNLYIKMSLDDVMKLQYYNIYQEVKK